MKLSFVRESFLGPLQQLASVAGRKQTLPILGYVLCVVEGNRMSMTATDTEIEVVGRTTLQATEGDCAFTVPAKKTLDILRSLPEFSLVEVKVEDSQLRLKCNNSRFTLASLPTQDFPKIESSPATFEMHIKQEELLCLLNQTAFSMANQDVRYYLNGMLFEAQLNRLNVVATDGHRMAVSSQVLNQPTEYQKVILPRKGVQELQRLLAADEAEILLTFCGKHFKVETPEFSMTSRLIGGKFPEYEGVIKARGSSQITLNREDFRQALIRASILSNEKSKGVSLLMEPGILKVYAQNAESEVAEEELPLDYQAESIKIDFNVSYLQDVLGALTGTDVKMFFGDSSSSILIEEAENPGPCCYVIMPMCL